MLFDFPHQLSVNKGLVHGSQVIVSNIILVQRFSRRPRIGRSGIVNRRGNFWWVLLFLCRRNHLLVGFGSETGSIERNILRGAVSEGRVRLTWDSIRVSNGKRNRNKGRRLRRGFGIRGSRVVVDMVRGRLLRGRVVNSGGIQLQRRPQLLDRLGGSLESLGGSRCNAVGEGACEGRVYWVRSERVESCLRL